MQRFSRATLFIGVLLSLLFPCFGSAFAQTPYIAYMIPDIGTPGANTYVEILAPYNREKAFGQDNIYLNNSSDIVRVVCANPSDTSFIKIGPCVVSWNGKLVSTQIFVMNSISVNTTDWQQGIKVPIQVIVNAVVSNVDTFYIVKPQHLGFNNIFSSGGNFGTGIQSGTNFGFRSRRGAMIVDSLVIVGNGTYYVSTQDCDPSINGNQGYLPLILISRGNITLSSSAIINLSGSGSTGGPGGGGGGNGLTCGTVGGDGFTGGGGNGDWNANCGAAIPEGKGSGNLKDGLNAIPGGGSSNQNEGGGGGTGHPFGSSGSSGGDDSNSPIPVTPGYGGGTGGPQCCDPQQHGGGGGGGYGSIGNDGGFWSGKHSGGNVVGNAQIVPIAGGSGGGGGNVNSTTISDASNGGGGGGAITLYGLNTIIQGTVASNGGDGKQSANNGAGGGGSGGAVVCGSKLNLSVGTVGIAGGAGGTGGPVGIVGQNGGVGGVGRVRFDGKKIGPKTIISNGAQLYQGPSTDTSGYVNKTFTLTGSGNGKDIRVYIRPLSGAWFLAATVTGYTNNWSKVITLPSTDTLFFLAVAEQVLNPNKLQYSAEPVWVLSQAGANFIHSYCSGPELAFSKSPIDFGSVSICSERIDTLIINNIGCDTANLVKSFDNQNIGFSFQRIGTSNLGNQKSDTILVRFKPNVPGAVSTILRIKLPNGDSMISVLGLGTNGDTAITPSPRIIDFGTVSICSDTLRVAVLTNTGCDSVIVKQIISPAGGDFSISRSPLGRSLGIGDTTSIVLDKVSSNIGQKDDSVSLLVETPSGAKQTITIYIHATVIPKRRQISFDNFIRFDSLAPCTPFDTTLWVKNLGVCDTLIFSSVGVSGFALLSASSTGISKRILPGDSLPITIHIVGSNNMNGIAIVRLQGNGIDTVLTIQTTTSKGRAIMTLSVTDSIFSSSYCDPRQETFTFRNASCDTIIIDKLVLNGSGQFSFVPTPALPHKIAPGESYPIVVEFNPVFSGDSLVSLDYHFVSGNLSGSIALRGRLQTTKETARITMQLDAQSSPKQQVGVPLGFDLICEDAIRSSVPMTSLQVTLQYNDNLLTPRVNPATSTGAWTVSGVTPANGKLTVDFARVGNTPIIAGSLIGHIAFRTSIGDTDKTSITTQTSGFNHSDPVFTSCVLATVANSKVDFALDLQCGEPALIHYLSNKKIISDIFVAPNPASGNDRAATVQLQLQSPTTLTLSLFDALGKMVRTEEHHEKTIGEKRYSIPLQQASNGRYILRIATDGQTENIPFIIQK